MKTWSLLPESARSPYLRGLNEIERDEYMRIYNIVYLSAQRELLRQKKGKPRRHKKKGAQ